MSLKYGIPALAWKIPQPDQYINITIMVIVGLAVLLFALMYKTSKGSSGQDIEDGDSIQNFKHRNKNKSY